MRAILIGSLLLSAACAGSQPAPTTPDAQASFADRTRTRWKREEEQRQYEERQRAFASGAAERGAVQP
jgi:hypothetical protein